VFYGQFRNFEHHPQKRAILHHQSHRFGGHQWQGRQFRLSLPSKIAGVALTRIAMRSVPGAIIVGGVLLAKHLHDAKKDKVKAEATPAPTPKTT
jgi:1,4-dihydroxy-2-naphthoate octaprenyltransferase